MSNLLDFFLMQNYFKTELGLTIPTASFIEKERSGLCCNEYPYCVTGIILWFL